MAETRQTPAWLAFLAGAVAMLALSLAWSAWRLRDEAADATRVVAHAAGALPGLRRADLPIGPRLPEPPIPVPK